MSVEDMERLLRKLLNGCRYLLVIDDVWHRDAWDSLKRTLPENKNGSRIIITTRIETVAELPDKETFVHKLRFLTQEESWKLFCNKAFCAVDADRHHRPPDLEKLGQEMVEQCNGLPLAIIVLGGLLSRKQPHEWPAMKEHIWRELRNNSVHISSLLVLSFKDLPHQLKPCFLYLGLFPEDSIISMEKLIQLWVAEGFIPAGEENLAPEEVATLYVKELIGRSLIQVVKRNWRGVATCRVHDLLRDLAINEGRKLKFLHVCDGIINSAPLLAEFSYRRLALRSRPHSYKLLDHASRHMRTISLFFDNDSYSREQLSLIDKKFRSLRVLGLSDVYSARQEENIMMRVVNFGKLSHLRYLELETTGIVKIPKSVGSLQALQTLRLSSAYPTTLPRDVYKLKQLKHLIGSFGEPPFLSKESTNLVVLKTVHFGHQAQRDDGGLVLNCIAKLRNLKFLSLRSYYISLSIQPLLCCWNLVELKIKGQITDLPVEMHEFLPNLKFLELEDCLFQHDPILALGLLQNLIVLKLYYVRSQTPSCTVRGFPKLEVFMRDHYSLPNLQVEEAAMPRLRALSMANDRRYFPERLRSLPDPMELNWEWHWELDA